MPVNASLETDLSLLLAPIPGDNPCGEALRYTDVYDRIRDARREEDQNLPQGVWKSEIKKADWDEVDRLCQDALKNRSKDLQIAAWLTEAWLHLEGVGGLSRGISLILGLTQSYWEHVYPQIEEKGYELRIVPYEWLNSRLSEESQQVLISMPSDRSALPYRMLDYLEANRSELASKKSKAPPPSDEKLPSLSKVFLSIDQTPTPFYRYVGDSCVEALALMADLEEELRHHLDGEAPSFYRLREKIESIQRVNAHILEERGEKKKEKREAPLNLTQAVSSRKKGLLGPIESREQAYGILGEVASYLEKIEPHSPTPYLIRRAIVWGGMNLSQVFADTMTNGHDLSLLLDILEVKKEE